MRTVLVGVATIAVATAVLKAQSKPAGDECVTFSSHGHLNGGQSFHFYLPQDLEVRLVASTQFDYWNAWEITVGPKGTGDDFSWIVSPPWQFAPHRMIGPAYGMSARESAQGNRSLNFVLTRQDLQQAIALKDHIDSGREVSEAVKDLQALGRGTFGIDIDEAGLNKDDPDVIEWIQFSGWACVPRQ